MTLRLLIEHHLEFLSLKKGCTDSSKSTLVKMPHCWKSRYGSNVFSAAVVIYPVMFSDITHPVMFSDFTLQLSYILLCFQTLRYSCHISCYVFRHYATVVIYPVMFSDITLQLSYILFYYITKLKDRFSLA